MSVNFNDLIATKPVTETASKSQASLVSGAKTLGDSYTTFLSLLTTQLQNQDPTSPLDTNAFTQQLVQMTGVQQQLLSNELLQQLVTLKDNSGYEAVGLIGKSATVAGTDAQLTDGKAQWQYDLPSSAVEAKLTITDSTGAVVWEGDAPSTTQGKHAFQWDGKDKAGKTRTEGTYTLKVAAHDSADTPIVAKIYATGKVTAVEQSNGTTLVTVGGAQAPLSAIVSVTA